MTNQIRTNTVLALAAVAMFALTFTATSANAAALWTPAQITTTAWYDAADASTITTSGGNVTDWLDKSGDGKHLTQGTASDQPAFVAAGINGLDVLEFANRTEDMDAISNIDAQWAAVLLQYNGAPAFSQALGSQTAFGGDNYTVQYRGDVNVDRWQNPYYTNGNPESNTGAAVNVDPTIVIHSPISLTSFDLQVGGDRGINNRGWDGYIAEVILGNQTLTTELRQTIEGYLAHKWGTVDELPGDHPFKSEAPTFESVIPEPSSFALTAFGLLSLGLVGWRRRNR